MEFVEIAKQAKTASLEIADLSTEIKNKALHKNEVLFVLPAKLLIYLTPVPDSEN